MNPKAPRLPAEWGSAREYGIPAVVATDDATFRLVDGQLVTVDSGAGPVEVQHQSGVATASSAP